MDIELFKESRSEVALRNEEVNKNRLSNTRLKNTDGGLKITDKAAFSRLVNEMNQLAQEQEKISAEREAERKRREGTNYKSPEERAEIAKNAKSNQPSVDDEARCIDQSKKLDHSKDYYAILEIDCSASAAEVRQAYKRLALFYHPDKHNSKTSDMETTATEQENSLEARNKAIAEKFREISFAYDVLSDEQQRALYDKCRDFVRTNPGKGLPILTPEEAAMMASGISELRKLRKMGIKAGKHPPLHKYVDISLPKLNFGCIRAVEVTRNRVDYAGMSFESKKTFHLIIRKGSREGDQIPFAGEGNETVDTEPGDCIFTLRQKPHPSFRRVNEKDLEVFAGAVPTQDILYLVEVPLLSGSKTLVVVHALLEALLKYGLGGVYRKVLPGLGLFDAAKPLDNPPGDLYVSIRYPPVLLNECYIRCMCTVGSIYMLGCHHSAVCGALVGGFVSVSLRHKIESQEMIRESMEKSSKTAINAVFLTLDVTGSEITQKSPSCSALLRAMQKHLSGFRLQTTVDVWNLDLELDDGVWSALYEADVIYIEASDFSSDSCESIIGIVHNKLEASGVLDMIFQKHWRGCHIITAGLLCSVLGLFSSSSSSPVILPFYSIRVCNRYTQGWYDAYQSYIKTDKKKAVGLLETSAFIVNSVHGTAELIVAPRKEILVEAAGWKKDFCTSLDDDNNDFGYFIEF